MPLFRRPKPDVPLTALGRPWRSSVEPGLRTGLFDDVEGSPDGPDDEDAELAAIRSTLDPEIVSDLDDFADAVETLSPGDLGRLHAFWRNIDEEARMSAYDRAQRAAERTGRREVIRQFQDELLTWSRAYQGISRAAPERMLIPTDDPLTLVSGRHEVRPALVDTMVALALQDELDDTDFETLFGPWRHAMGDEDEADEADEPDGGVEAGLVDPAPG
jgi:hypothetical protein